MIEIIKKVIALFNKIIIAILHRNIPTQTNKFYLSKFRVDKNNELFFTNTAILSTVFNIKGDNNSVISNDALISKCSINIKGKNNKLILDKNVKLRGATIHIRGQNCGIMIGEGTSTGGLRIVNVGKDNNITIGENCLFADYIEIWASDTHSILNEEGEQINKEKPIKIGNNVWVGSHVTILKGVTIGDWAIIGMECMVVKEIPPNTISVGNPNKVIKEGVTWKLQY